MRQFGRSVGHPTYMGDSCLCERPISGFRLKERIRLSVGSGFVRLEAVCIAQYQGRIQRSVGRREGSPPPRILPCFAERGRRVHPCMCEVFGSDPSC